MAKFVFTTSQRVFLRYFLKTTVKHGVDSAPCIVSFSQQTVRMSLAGIAHFQKAVFGRLSTTSQMFGGLAVPFITSISRVWWAFRIQFYNLMKKYRTDVTNLASSR
mmetsp:Transcript_87418/g.174901  ORF Transcript_87418/g.174901 Transcript_87418/m.174901 type:complete len:106 (-) Transcript_87418:1737-2054(-)